MLLTESQAVVLHRRPYRESSLLVELITPGHGRIGVVARGARTLARGGRRFELEPFQLIDVCWRGRGELGLLTAAELREAFTPAPGVGLLAGLYLNELILAVLQRGEPHPQIYAAYLSAIAGLSHDTDPAHLRRFEWVLLCEQGLSPNLALDRGGAPIDPAACFQLDEHGRPVAAAGGFPGSALLALAAGEFPEEFALVHRQLLAALWRPHLPRPLHSPELIRGLRALGIG